MTKRSPKYGTRWSREELILTLYLYCQIPFAKTKRTNPEVIRLAKIIDRTPSAVALKLGNFGAFDERLAKQGISGLRNYSKADRKVWDEFYGYWESLIEESQRILRHTGAEKIIPTEDQEDFPVISSIIAPTEKLRTVSVRLGQSFFRKTVIASYRHTCCICGADLPELLIASHIIPWSIREETRIDPRNGLALCVLHDKAFDRGLIGINDNFEVLISSQVFFSSSDFIQTSIANYQARRINLPSRFWPKIEYLSWHANHVFLS